jgi:hypothetical protein
VIDTSKHNSYGWKYSWEDPPSNPINLLNTCWKCKFGPVGRYYKVIARAEGSKGNKWYLYFPTDKSQKPREVALWSKDILRDQQVTQEEYELNLIK